MDDASQQSALLEKDGMLTCDNTYCSERSRNIYRHRLRRLMVSLLTHTLVFMFALLISRWSHMLQIFTLPNSNAKSSPSLFCTYKDLNNREVELMQLYQRRSLPAFATSSRSSQRTPGAMTYSWESRARGQRMLGKIS